VRLSGGQVREGGREGGREGYREGGREDKEGHVILRILTLCILLETTRRHCPRSPRQPQGIPPFLPPFLPSSLPRFLPPSHPLHPFMVASRRVPPLSLSLHPCAPPSSLPPFLFADLDARRSHLLSRRRERTQGAGGMRPSHGEGRKGRRARRRGEWWGRRDQDESQRARMLGIGLAFVIENERGCNETQRIKADESGYKGGGSHSGKNIHIYECISGGEDGCGDRPPAVHRAKRGQDRGHGRRRHQGERRRHRGGEVKV